MVKFLFAIFKKAKFLLAVVFISIETQASQAHLLQLNQMKITRFMNMEVCTMRMGLSKLVYSPVI